MDIVWGGKPFYRNNVDYEKAIETPGINTPDIIKTLDVIFLEAPKKVFLLEAPKVVKQINRALQKKTFLIGRLVKKENVRKVIAKVFVIIITKNSLIQGEKEHSFSIQIRLNSARIRPLWLKHESSLNVKYEKIPDSNNWTCDCEIEDLSNEIIRLKKEQLVISKSNLNKLFDAINKIQDQEIDQLLTKIKDMR